MEEEGRRREREEHGLGSRKEESREEKGRWEREKEWNVWGWLEYVTLSQCFGHRQCSAVTRSMPCSARGVWA